MAIFGIIIVALIFIALICLLLAWPFMWMWNYAVVAALDIANPIDYWIAFWLMLFISLFIAGSRLQVQTKS